MTSLAQLGARSAGVWTRAEALEMLAPGQVRGLVDQGVWQRPWPGVYADAGHQLGPEQRAIAAVLASGGAGQPVRIASGRVLRAVACGRTAARVHGLLLLDDDDPATGAEEHLMDEVAVWRHLREVRSEEGSGGRPRVLHRRRVVLHEGDLGRTPSGLWLTSRTRTVLCCATVLAPEALVAMLDDALHRELLTTAQLDLLAQRTAPGVRQLRHALALADGRAESPGETLARLLLQPVLPGLRPQVELYDRAARLVARFDLGDEALRLAVEMDGARGHAGEVMRAKDDRRDRRTKGYGWVTERATWWDVRRGQQAFVARVLDAARRLDPQTGGPAAHRSSR